MGLGSMLKDVFFPVMESFIHGSLDTYCDIETIDGSNLIMKDGSICTAFKFDGASQLMGNDDLYDTSNSISEKLAPSFNHAGHAIQVVFSRSPDTTKEIVNNIIKGPRYSAKKLGMDLEGLFEEQEKMLEKEIFNETCYIFLWTRSTIISKRELKEEREQNRSMYEKALGTLFSNAGDIQNLIGKSKLLSQRHNTFTENFLSDMLGLDLVLKKLDCNEAINAIINNIYPDKTSRTFRIRGPNLKENTGTGILSENDIESTISGKRKKGHWMRVNTPDNFSYLMWPKIGEQIFIEDGKHINSNIVRLGNLYMSSVAMTLGPQNVSPFSNFVNTMPRNPYRVCFSIEGDGLAGMRTKEVLSSITKITNKGHNGPIAREITEMTEVKNHGGTLDSTIVRIRINFSTWCSISKGKEEIEKRTMSLISGIERWGNSQASSSSGDPMGGVLSSVGGLTMKSTAPFGAAPLPEITYMLPWQRETSPWENGWALKTYDNRIFPYALGSSEQNTFVDIVYATPGKGKSVLLNTLNFSFCMSEQNIGGAGGAKLPMCRILDIGPSSAGLISLLQSSLPEDRKHEAIHLRMSSDPSISAINIFDTPLGCRRPIPYDKEFIVRFISIFLEENGKLPRFAADIISQSIDLLYARYDDKNDLNSTPKVYKKGQSYEIDEAINKYEMNVTENETTWWTIVDRFTFAYDDTRMASLAQRYAVPLLEDLYSMNFKPIEDTFGAAISDQMQVLEIFKMAINGIIRDYQILNTPTKMDFSNARVVALDLQQVCGSDESALGKKKTSLMYMLARYITTKGFFYGPDDINMFQEEYRKYHKPILKRNQSSSKRIVYDEFHKTGGSPSVRSQIIKDMREGRKWKVQISLASQRLEDFDTEMLGLAASTFLLGVQNDSDVRNAKEWFSLSNLAGKILKRDLSGPGPKGAPMLALVQTKEGATQEHFLFNKLSAQFIWAFNTTREDADLRDILYEKIGVKEALRILGIKFKSGGAKKTLEALNRNLVESQGGNVEEDHEISDGIIIKLAQELQKESLLLNK